jgi:hypothetical protein
MTRSAIGAAASRSATRATLRSIATVYARSPLTTALRYSTRTVAALGRKRGTAQS